MCPDLVRGETGLGWASSRTSHHRWSRDLLTKTTIGHRSISKCLQLVGVSDFCTSHVQNVVGLFVLFSMFVFCFYTWKNVMGFLALTSGPVIGPDDCRMHLGPHYQTGLWFWLFFLSSVSFVVHPCQEPISGRADKCQQEGWVLCPGRGVCPGRT